MKLMGELEVEMMEDLYQRVTNVCLKKCIPPSYKDTELNKGEAVCTDRCVAKYLEIHELVGKKLTSIQQDEFTKVQSAMQEQNPK